MFLSKYQSAFRLSAAVFAAVAGLIVCSGKSANAQALGAASNYNIFVLGNYTSSSSDSEGAVAVGGNATFTAYSVASELSAGSAANLVVGGTLTGTYGTVNGSVYAGTMNWTDPSINGNIDANQVNLSGNGTVTGTVTYASSYNNSPSPTTVDGTVKKGSLVSPINFSSTDKTLTNDASSWGGLLTNGTVTSQYSTLSLTGTSKTLNIFDIPAADLNSNTSVVVNAPAGSTVLVNITGNSATWSGNLTLSGGVTANDVIYNFVNASTLNISGISVLGTVFAPDAALNFSSGEIHGNIIAGSMTGNGEAHNGDDSFNGDLFAGILPNGSQIGIVPEPSEIVTLLLGFMTMLGFVLLKRNNRGLQS